MKPFGIISDTHCHSWTSFATTLEGGINSRLQMILDETKRASAEVQKAGGDTLYHGGDLFHVRGSLAPSVLNPTVDCYRDIISSGVRVIINAGNHDLESKQATRISSAITALEAIGCKVINHSTYDAEDEMAVIPWIPNINDLKVAIEAIDPSNRSNCDLLLHAPIDGVIKGLPDHGITDTYLAGLGFRRVFSGHYHHHRDFGNGVYSIGASTHQTWSDVGSKAGFLIVDGPSVTWRATHAPSFVIIDASTDTEEIPLIVDGNYVKVTISTTKTSEIDAMRQYLADCGALGVIVLAEKASATVSERTGGTYKAGTTLEASIGDYIKSRPFERPAELAAMCQEFLTQVRSV